MSYIIDGTVDRSVDRTVDPSVNRAVLGIISASSSPASAMWLLKVRFRVGEASHVSTAEFDDFVTARDARDWWRERDFWTLLYPVLE